VHLAHLVVDAGVKKNPFRRSSFARINVRDDTNITVQINGGYTRQNILLDR
jgi:hypothetical protein